MYVKKYLSPIAEYIIEASDAGIVGIWASGQKYFPANLPPESEYSVLTSAAQWLNDYFAGNNPSLNHLPLAPHGNAFRQAVWAELLKIPYGQTTTYGAIARTIGCGSAQAVGGAVGHNPISIIIPCHRVLGSNGTLTGYAGGLNIKEELLKIEKIQWRPTVMQQKDLF